VSAAQMVGRSITWAEVYRGLARAPHGRLWGIPRGGAIVAGLTGRAVEDVESADAIVDDVIDSGATMARYRTLYPAKRTWALVTKHAGDGWLRFPWEHHDTTAELEDTVRRQLEWIGEDPMRPGLQATPARVLRALGELTSGYKENPGALLAVQFPEDGVDQMIVVRGVRFSSLCEHHMLPFTGTATVGYVPQPGRVVGLSKLARLVLCFARRLQVQERLTQQITAALDTHLGALGAGCVVRARHSCMAIRGVRANGEMVTSSLTGVLRVDGAARAEFLALARGDWTEGD